MDSNRKSAAGQFEMKREQIIQMPRPTGRGATRWQRWRTRIGIPIRCLLRRITDVGIVRPFKIDDALTGQHIEIRVGILFTVIAVNGRDYYFGRFGGKFDGTGSGCGCRPALAATEGEQDAAIHTDV